jgi:hypothetical protein
LGHHCFRVAAQILSRSHEELLERKEFQPAFELLGVEAATDVTVDVGDL